MTPMNNIMHVLALCKESKLSNAGHKFRSRSHTFAAQRRGKMT